MRSVRSSVQELMAHTDPDMTRAYQKGHARKLLRVEMLLPLSVTPSGEDGVQEERGFYPPHVGRQKIFPDGKSPSDVTG